MDKNKKDLIVKEIQEVVVLEMGRYISCATTNADREKAYPRSLFEERMKKVVAEVCDKYLVD